MARRNRPIPLRKPLLTEARIAELREFEMELVALCGRYRFELSGSRDSCEAIEVYDGAEMPLPDGHPFVAIFHNIDAEGTFRCDDSGELKIREAGIEVCEWESDGDEWSGPVDPPPAGAK